MRVKNLVVERSRRERLEEHTPALELDDLVALSRRGLHRETELERVFVAPRRCDPQPAALG